MRDIGFAAFHSPSALCRKRILSFGTMAVYSAIATRAGLGCGFVATAGFTGSGGGAGGGSVDMKTPSVSRVKTPLAGKLGRVATQPLHCSRLPQYARLVSGFASRPAPGSRQNVG